jgi:hypothetical protein
MKNGFFIFVFALTTTLSPIFACDIDGKTGFMPENNLHISVEDKATNGMTEETFTAIVNSVYETYAPIVKAKGATLKMDNNWKDTTVNAYANRTGKIWHVNMFGGLARHPLVTEDGFRLVVCHETGHHLGGFPKVVGNTWAANEGQADYFGTLKCMKRVLSKEDNQAVVAKLNLDPAVATQCEQVYKSADEIALCERIAMAGKSLALLLSELGKNNSVSFTTPDPAIVQTTFDAHPQAQCRLDTYFAGSLCDKSFTEDVSEINPIPGVCIKKDGYSVGTRPLCWYKPSDSEI